MVEKIKSNTAKGEQEQNKNDPVKKTNENISGKDPVFH